MPGRYAVWILACVLVPLPGAAQEPAPRPDVCTYAACALRVQGNDILAGTEGRKVTSFGFLDAPRLVPWAATSDSAAHYLAIVEDDYVPGRVFSLTGVVLTWAGITAAGAWEGSDKAWVGLAVSVLGLGGVVHGDARQRRARRALHSAIWWYNGSLATDQIPGSVPRDEIAPFLRPPGDRRRGGLVVGSIVGLGAGLAVSSRHQSEEVAAGLSETLAIGALGGFLGWTIGRNLER